MSIKDLFKRKLEPPYMDDVLWRRMKMQDRHDVPCNHYIDWGGPMTGCCWRCGFYGEHHDHRPG